MKGAAEHAKWPSTDWQASLHKDYSYMMEQIPLLLNLSYALNKVIVSSQYIHYYSEMWNQCSELYIIHFVESA